MGSRARGASQGEAIPGCLTMHSSSDDQRLARMLIGGFDGPAFVRRMRRIEDAERLLADHLRQKRAEYLTMVRLRIGQLRALAGDWPALLALVASPEAIAAIRDLHDELQPELRCPLRPARSARVLRAALRELANAMTAFNRRWETCLAQIDLGPINALREGYNKHYLIEKECAVGNARVARMGFRRLEPMRPEELFRDYPLLSVPHLEQ